MTIPPLRSIAAAFCAILLSVSLARADTITKFPESLDKACRDGTAKIYDECADQMEIFSAALERANREGKTLLVSYGAEWCIWCHVFDAHISGGKSKFTYVYADPAEPDNKFESTLYEREKTDVTQEADALSEFVAQNFVVAHIEDFFSENGYEVLLTTGAEPHHDGSIPYVFTVDSKGIYAGHFEHNRAETRRDKILDWYRGYNRQELIAELSRIRDLAQQ